jgi:hypothetical protein
MRSEESPKSAADRNRRWPSLDAWLLGTLAACGLVGFVVVFGLVLGRAMIGPQAAAPVAHEAQPTATAPAARGEPGARGERGPPGPPGPRGDAGIRILRHGCEGGNCSVQCEDDEVLLTAHCGIGRTPAVYPTEHSALCRSRATARVEVVAACVKASRR